MQNNNKIININRIIINKPVIHVPKLNININSLFARIEDNILKINEGSIIIPIIKNAPIIIINNGLKIIYSKIQLQIVSLLILHLKL
jgi:hypothetical protein